MRWHTKFGKYWALHWQFDSWVSFGFHIDFKRRKNAQYKIKFGPYLDIHFLCFIFSIGYNPIYSTCPHADVFRAGRGIEEG